MYEWTTRKVSLQIRVKRAKSRFQSPVAPQDAASPFHDRRVSLYDTAVSFLRSPDALGRSEDAHKRSPDSLKASHGTLGRSLGTLHRSRRTPLLTRCSFPVPERINRPPGNPFHPRAIVPAFVICIAASRGFATIIPRNAMARSSNESTSANGKDSSGPPRFDALVPVRKDLAADSPNGAQYASLGQPQVCGPTASSPERAAQP